MTANICKNNKDKIINNMQKQSNNKTTVTAVFGNQSCPQLDGVVLAAFHLRHLVRPCPPSTMAWRFSRSNLDRWHLTTPKQPKQPTPGPCQIFFFLDLEKTPKRTPFHLFLPSRLWANHEKEEFTNVGLFRVWVRTAFSRFSHSLKLTLCSMSFLEPAS